MNRKIYRYSRLKFLIVFLLFIPTIINSNLYAQNHGPFSSITLGAKAVFNVNNNLVNNYWDPSTVAELLAEVPFFIGRMQAGFLFMEFKGKEKMYPDFSGKIFYVGFGDEINLPFNFELYSGVKFGYFLMSFHDETLTSYQKTESEFLAGVNFRLSYMLLANFYISASSDFSLVFTHEKLKFYFLSAGAAYKFGTPAWLEGFFN